VAAETPYPGGAVVFSLALFENTMERERERVPSNPLTPPLKRDQCPYINI